MKITHVALWTCRLESLADFWVRVFGAKAGSVYVSSNRPGFRSCWLTLPSGPSIELMTGPWVEPSTSDERVGYAHLALSVGSKEIVDQLALKMKDEGMLVGYPRFTGDGFYEAILRDPDGNLIEITV